MTLQEIQYKAQGIIHKWRDDDSAPYIEFVEELAHMIVPEPSEDLEEYASSAGFDYVDNIVQEHPGHRFNDHDVEFAYRDGIIAGAKWQENKVQETIRLAEDHAYLAGADWQKEQMMKEAVNGWLDEDNEPPYDLNVLCEEKIPFGKFKHGDKVKLIIVKE